MKHKLLFLLPAINPYWADRLNRLSARGLIEFEVWMLERRGRGREWVVELDNLTFDYVFLPRGWRRYLEIGRRWKRLRPSHVLSFHFVWQFWPVFLSTAFSRVKLAFYAEKTWDSWVRRSLPKEVAKHLLFRLANIVFVPGGDAEEYVRRYGGRRVGFGPMPHVVDRTLWASARVPRPHVPGQLRVLYMGRLIVGKGLHVLTDAFDLLQEQELSRMSLTVVGSGPMESDLRIWSGTTGLHVEIVSFVQSHELAPFVADADVLVFPTLGDPYGLVVDESIAAALPVLVSDAAGEIVHRVCDGPVGERGLIHRAGDAAELSAQLSQILSDPEELAQFSRNARSFLETSPTMDDWAQGLEHWVFSR